MSYGKERFICKNCKTSRVENYTYNVNQQIIITTKEDLGIRSIAKVLKISTKKSFHLASEEKLTETEALPPPLPLSHRLPKYTQIHDQFCTNQENFMSQ